MKKIIYFDLWTKGIRCFKPIDDELKLRNVETKLIHCGSFSSPHKKSEVIDGISVFDISHYKTVTIFKALAIEKPTAVLSLNTTFIWDRALVMACKELKIPCYFAMHGDFFLKDELAHLIDNDKKRNSIFTKLPKLHKYIRFHVVNYLYSYFKISTKPYSFYKVFSIFLNNFLNPAKERYFPKINTDLIYNKAFIYSKLYLEHYQKVGYKKSDIIITGYPEYDIIYTKLEQNLFSKEDLPKEVAQIVNNEEKYALYLDSAFADGNFYGWTHEYRNKELTRIGSKMKEQNLFLVVKIHPSNTQIENIKVNLDNVIIVKHADLPSLSYFCEFAIILASTSNNIPFLMNKPLVVPKWGLSKQIPNKFSKEVMFEWNNIDDKIELNLNNQKNKLIQNIIPRVNNTNASTIIVDEMLSND